jgi:hypothetical protein
VKHPHFFAAGPDQENWEEPPDQHEPVGAAKTRGLWWAPQKNAWVYHTLVWGLLPFFYFLPLLAENNREFRGAGS